MAKIIRVLEHNGVLFKENDVVKVTFEDGRQIRGPIRIPTMDCIVIGMYDFNLYEVKHIKHINKLN